MTPRQTLLLADQHRRRAEAARSADVALRMSAEEIEYEPRTGILSIFRRDRGGPPPAPITFSAEETAAIAEALRYVAAKNERQAADLEDSLTVKGSGR